MVFNDMANKISYHVKTSSLTIEAQKKDRFLKFWKDFSFLNLSLQFKRLTNEEFQCTVFAKRWPVGKKTIHFCEFEFEFRNIQNPGKKFG